MENINIDNRDNSAIMTIEENKIVVNGEIRVNNMGQLEECIEGYWQVVEWKYSIK